MKYVEYIKGHLSSIFIFCAIIVAGIFITFLIGKIFKRALKKTSLDPSLQKFLVKSILIVLYSLTILSALSSIGISTTGVVAVFSAAAVAIAVALKDSLGNVAGGILLLVSPRFYTGDYIIVEGDEGTVLNIDLLHTCLRSPDYKHISIPNGVLINSHIINCSREDLRRIDLEFPIPYESDFELAKKIAIDTIKTLPHSIQEKTPFAGVKRFDDSSVVLKIEAWCKSSDYWNLYYDLTESIRKNFNDNNINIPYNQLKVYIKNGNSGE